MKMVGKNKDKIQKLDKEFLKVNWEHTQMQEWFEKSIKINIGIFDVNDKHIIYDAKSLNLFHYESSAR